MSYENSRLSEIFSRNDSYQERTFEEVNLPFDDIEEDYIPGDELRQSLTSSDLKDSMEEYSIHSAWSEDRYEVTMVKKDSSNLSFLNSSDPYISFEGRSDVDYSHLRIELAASGKRELEELSDDLDSLEEGLEEYFQSEQVLDQEAGKLIAAD